MGGGDRARPHRAPAAPSGWRGQGFARRLTARWRARCRLRRPDGQMYYLEPLFEPETARCNTDLWIGIKVCRFFWKKWHLVIQIPTAVLSWCHFEHFKVARSNTCITVNHSSRGRPTRRRRAARKSGAVGREGNCGRGNAPCKTGIIEWHPLVRFSAASSLQQIGSLAPWPCKGASV